MNSLFSTRIAGFAILSTLLLPGLALADQLRMENGDLITGEIISITADTVTINPAYGAEYEIDRAAVVSIDTDKVFDIGLADGSRVEGTFEGLVDGQQTIDSDGDTVATSLVEIVDAVDPLLVEEVDPFEGTGEFGFVNTTGNTETVALNMRLNFLYTTDKWRHRFTGTALNTSEDGIKDNERYTMEVQSDRKLSDINWLFGAFRWDADKFGSYDPSISLTAGYGHQLMKSERHEMRGEIGAGYRRLTETESRLESSEAIARFLIDDWWQVFSNTRWTNRLLVETGSSNTFFQFDTGLTVSMTDRFAIKLGFQARHNTTVPPGDTEKTDTVTSANIVYDF